MFSLEVVLEWNTTPGSGPPESEIKLAQSKGVLVQICHFNVSNERWILIVGEDILEQGFEVTCLINRYLLVGQTKVWLPFEMAARPPDILPSYWTIMPWCPCLSMYITLTGFRNGEPVSLAKTLSEHVSAELLVPLCELTFYFRWDNISSAHENNKVVNGDHVTWIPDGY